MEKDSNNNVNAETIIETAQDNQYTDVAEATAIKNEQKAAEKLERMNGVFDRLIVPIIIFTILIIVGAGVIPKWVASCAQSESGSVLEDDIVMSQGYTFYTKRAELLDSISDNVALFEEHDYLMMEDEDSGYIAYRVLDSGTEIMENLTDQNGNHYSAVFKTEGDTELTIMIYSRSVFLAIAEVEDERYSAIFESDSFLADASSSDIEALLGVVTTEQLTALMDEYKASLEELF